MSVYGINSIKDLLCDNTYPGRGIIVGITSDGIKAVSAYFIMGRSENSRNRVFVEKDGEVTIYPYDASKVKDPSLIIYSPVRKYKNSLIVTNGDQTDTVYEFLEKGSTFEEALDTRCFEPDAPNLTPRISALLGFGGEGFTYKLNILKSADESGSACNRYTFAYTPVKGLGHFIHTYNHDGDPIPTFTGEPERVGVSDSIDELTDIIWNSLNETNKVSLYVRYDNLRDGTFESRLINKNK
ncbi:MAG: IMP cyclohydrolase [Eubacteriales bacterium]|nr:IMP cyclohydrolase [Eubacteriales bacterium]